MKIRSTVITLNHAKKCWCFLFFLIGFAIAPLSSQMVLPAKSIEFRDAALDKSFAHYEVFEIDISELQQAGRTKDNFVFSIQPDKMKSWEITLQPHDIRGPNYREVALTESGPQVLPRRPNITYKGKHGSKREEVRFSITDTYILGMIEEDGETWFIEPLSKIVARAFPNQYFVYKVSDVLTDPTVECTYTAAIKQGEPQIPEEKSHAKRMGRMACFEVELATAGDFTMFQKYGSVQAVNDFIINITNLMEPLYDIFNLNYLIVDQFVPTSAAANPWTTSDEAFDILDDFSVWAPVNFLTHDVGQIWTNRDIQGCGGGPDNFNLAGCAQAIGDVCGAQRYNVCEDFSASTNCLRVLSAHEFGHTWDGVHGEAGASTIMNGTIQCGATTWAAGNITRIQNHIDSRVCLQDCGTLCSINVSAIFFHETCPNANDGIIISLISGQNNPVTYVLTGPLNATNNTGVFVNLPDGNYTLRAIDNLYNETCFDEESITINAGIDNTPPMPVCRNPSVTLDAMGEYTLSEVDVYNWGASTDNCGVVNFQSLTPVLVTCDDVGTPVLVTVTVNDGNGNTNSCISTVTVLDDTPPVAVCKDHVVTFNGEQEIILQAADIWDEMASFDNCGPVFFVSANPPAIHCDELGTIIPVTVTIEDSNGNPATCISNVSTDGLPCGWSQHPDGINCINGNQISYDVPSEVFTATSTNCFYGPPFNSDAMAFAQYELCGNGTLTAEVTSIMGNSLGWAGLTMRENNTGGAKKFQLLTNLNTNLTRREIRTITNGISSVQQMPSQDRFWLRLVRQNNQFTGYASPNGSHWQPIMSQTFNMNACIQIGLVVTNYSQNSIVTATFDNVEVIEGSPLLPGNQTNAFFTVSAENFEIFPNPASSMINVDLSQYQGLEVELNIKTLQGQLLIQNKWNQVENTFEQIDLNSLINGMYLISVRASGKPEAVKRLVIQNSGFE